MNVLSSKVCCQACHKLRPINSTRVYIIETLIFQAPRADLIGLVRSLDRRLALLNIQTSGKTLRMAEEEARVDVPVLLQCINTRSLMKTQLNSTTL